MNTRWEVADALATLRPEDFIYLADGPRMGDRLIAPGHTGKVVVSPAPNGTPRLGSELIYEPTRGKTAEGMRVYRLIVPEGLPMTVVIEGVIDGQAEVSNISHIRSLAPSPQEGD